MILSKNPSLLNMPGRSILLVLNDVFFFLLGGSAWILINGIYTQLPFIIFMFDGDYGVASKITLCVTISSLLPIIFFSRFLNLYLNQTTKISMESRNLLVVPLARPIRATTKTGTSIVASPSYYQLHS